jgi:phosphate transport system permease protein
LLAFGRGIGDAASVLFTAGYSERIPGSLMDSVASLPLAVYTLLGMPYPAVQEKAYAAAAVLLIFVLSISLISRLLTKKAMRYVVE